MDEFVFIDATMSMGLKNTCKLFEEDFMKAFVKGLLHHHPKFSDKTGPLVDNYLDDIWFVAESHTPKCWSRCRHLVTPAPAPAAG